MKHKLFNTGTKLMLLPFLLSFPLYTKAENEDVNVEPNEYQEKDIKLNTDYLHENSLYEQRETLSEEQLMLKFDGEKLNENTMLADHLFNESDKGTNTITAKSEQFDITFERKLKASEQETIAQRPSNQSILITSLFVGAILLGIAVLFFLIPKAIQ